MGKALQSSQRLTSVPLLDTNVYVVLLGSIFCASDVSERVCKECPSVSDASKTRSIRELSQVGKHAPRMARLFTFIR